MRLLPLSPPQLLLLPLLLLLPVVSAAAQDTVAWSRLLPSVRRSESGGRRWAVLVAGSNTWGNYRHQADICHAYQILRSHGIPEEQIITMMYDDIANNEENPTPGIVVNRPNGSDVYGGVKIDYRGSEVTPENFLKILKGEGDGKVLRSGPQDHVFVNFADHGAPGLVAFPRGVLKAKQLMEALTFMHTHSMYGKLVFYMEACESGSMFEQLLKSNMNIYATTAANAHQSSYACYYDRRRGTYLGDLYSVSWMEDSDSEDIRSETLDRQFEIVRTKTNLSHVMKYGDESMGSLHVGDFQGSRKTSLAAAASTAADRGDAVSQREAPLAALRLRLRHATSSAEMQLLRLRMRRLQARRDVVARVFDAILRESVPGGSSTTAQFLSLVKLSINNFDCHHAVVDEISSRCFDLGETEEALAHVYKVVNLCESHIGTGRIISSVRAACPSRRL